MRAASEHHGYVGALAAPRSGKRIEIQGQVQGIGFRPFVFNLARDLDLAGYVANSSTGVRIEVEGLPDRIGLFVARLRDELPPMARIQDWKDADLPAAGRTVFSIIESDRNGPMRALVLPDIATCGACLQEINDPANRRYRYPFTNCTHCGPRYSIIEAMPYDRPFTTMARFTMCPGCLHEYDNPADRRFHAQPIACPQCGPQLALWSPGGAVLAEREEALAESVVALHSGRIVALKGLGGFQLLVDARNEAAVVALRARKRREAKPFALMFPSLDAARACAAIEPAHAALLQSPEAPIVLSPARAESSELAPSIAPDTYILGIMLPYTPLHHLLLSAFNGPLVVTSGNLGEEPICIDENEALDRLHGIADVFLVHDRPIARQVDDSIVTVIHGEPMMLRRARGYAPAPLPAATGQRDVLGTGGHLKNTVAFSKGGTIFPSQHIGNLENVPALEAFQRTITSMKRLFEMAPERIVHDLHPDYASTRFALEQRLPVAAVQHHFAHVLSCMAEHGLEGPVLGVSWDGTGYGTDGTIWGGEFLRCTRGGFDRIASLRPFRLPGGDTAVRDARRSAFSLLHEIHGGQSEALGGIPTLEAMTPQERRMIAAMLASGLNAPLTTSVGRLFDAVASLCGLCHHSAFEGQAAMRLERAAVEWSGDAAPLEFGVEHLDGRLILDWQPLVEQVVACVRNGTPAGAVAKGFHTALADGILRIAVKTGLDDIVLSGGCFQNKRLLEQAIYVLTEMNHKVYRHRAVPPNDGGIAIGQVWYRPEKEIAPCV